MADYIAFEDIQVGDRIRVSYTDEDFTSEQQGIVHEIDDYYASDKRMNVLAERYDTDWVIELLERPKPPVKVGDVVTQMQFAQLQRGTLGKTTVAGDIYPVWFLDGEHYIGRFVAKDVYALYGDVEIVYLPDEEEDEEDLRLPEF